MSQNGKPEIFVRIPIEFITSTYTKNTIGKGIIPSIVSSLAGRIGSYSLGRIDIVVKEKVT